jgi:hypothetical protein
MSGFKLPIISNSNTGTEQVVNADADADSGQTALANPLDALFTGRTTKLTIEAPKIEEAGTVDFKSKLESLRSLLAEDDLSLDILKMSLRRLKQHITDEPTIVAEMLPEDIGLLSQALFRTEKIRIIEEAKPKEKKGGKGKKASGPMPIFSAEELDF